MILYIKILKTPPPKLLELINKFSKVAGYKIDIQKSVVFLYSNNEISENIQTKSPIYLQKHQKQ